MDPRSASYEDTVDAAEMEAPLRGAHLGDPNSKASPPPLPFILTLGIQLSRDTVRTIHGALFSCLISGGKLLLCHTSEGLHPDLALTFQIQDRECFSHGERAFQSAV